MKILIDTNILIDVALHREAFFEDSAKVLDWAQLNPKMTAIAWHSVSNLAYIVKQDVRPFLSELLAFVEVASGNTSSVRQALAMPTRDLDDALQASAALAFGASHVVTRDKIDYRKIPIKTVTPKEFLKLVS